MQQKQQYEASLYGKSLPTTTSSDDTSVPESCPISSTATNVLPAAISDVQAGPSTSATLPTAKSIAARTISTDTDKSSLMSESSSQDSELASTDTGDNEIEASIIEKSASNKNLEIRRMSATEEGDKILNEAWTSPEKDKGKTPLEMVENIISNMEMPSPASTDDKSSVGSPALSGTNSPVFKGGLKSKRSHSISKQPLPEASKVMVPSAAQKPVSQSNQTKALIQNVIPNNPQAPLQSIQPAPAAAAASNQPYAAVQPVMQLVNTVNGPMLMQVNNQQPGLVQLPVSAASMSPGVPIPIMPVNQQISHQQVQTPVGVAKKRGKKKKVATPPRANPVPILMSPPVNQQQPSQTVQQIFTINQGNSNANIIAAATNNSQGMTQILPQTNLVLNQSGQVMNVGNQMIVSNGTLVSVPAMQTGVLFNQLPDGTLVQVQNNTGMIAAPMPMLQAGQPILAAGTPINGPIFVNNGTAPGPSQGGQVISGSTGTFFMTPQGLIQATTQPSPTHSATMSPVASSPQLVMLPTSSATKPMATVQQNKIPTSVNSKIHNSGSVSVTSKPAGKSSKDDTSDDSDSEEESEEDDNEKEEESKDDEEDSGQEETEEEEEEEEEVQEVQVKVSTSQSRKNSPTLRSAPQSPRSNPNSKAFLQSNQVDSSGLKATPPHSSGDFTDQSKLDLSVSTSMNESLDISTASGSSGLNSSSGSSGSKRRRRKRNADELLKEELAQTDEGKF